MCVCVSDSVGISSGLSSNIITHKLEWSAWFREVSGFGRDRSPMFALQMHKHVVSGIASTNIAKPNLSKYCKSHLHHLDTKMSKICTWEWVWGIVLPFRDWCV